MRQIRCKDCEAYLGEIRDASLRKDLVTLCQECYGPEFEETPSPYKNDAGLDQLKAIFGMKL